MSDIDDKYAQLKEKGLDLGALLAPEQDEAAGGRVRRYQNGAIYWDSATGAHEVHGGILKLYLDNGGPGQSPFTGGRELGYPISDEEIDRGVPRNRFETGAIYWTPGTGGCLLAHSIWDAAQQHPELGLPLTGNTPLIDGIVAYFERGVIFSTAGHAPGVDTFIVGTLQPPLMGNPLIIDPTDQNARRLSTVAQWKGLTRQLYDALIAWRPTIFTDLWMGRLVVSPVGSNDQLELVCTGAAPASETEFYVNVAATFEIFPSRLAPDLQDRTLYDLQLNLPHGYYNLSPHCIYVKKDWDNFGLFHITDLHITKRNEDMRVRLQQLGLQTAAKSYCNFQDNLRGFIKYANHLHSQGVADAVIATGDLIDYVNEDGDSSSNNNFARLRRLLLGEPFEPNGQAWEELKIPIFTTFGNHDYRLHPYNLLFDVNVPGKGTSHLDEYESFNIIQSDAIALEGGQTPTYGLGSLEDAVRMLDYDRGGADSYSYFEKFFVEEFSNNKRAIVVKLGKHRLVLMNTKFDNGVPESISAPTLIYEYLTKNLSPGTSKLIEGGAPDSFGFQDGSEFDSLRQAIAEAGNDGLVIVGMHTPALSPIGGEYPYYMRETVLPSADPNLMESFIQKNKLAGFTWTRTGAGYFKTGDVTDGMDAGVIAYGGLDLLKIFAGVGVSRPVDLVLWGHHHDRVEYRTRWNGSDLEYYMDFYTEAPVTYYHTYTHPTTSGSRPIPEESPIQVIIAPDASINAPVMAKTVNTLPGAPLTFGQVETLPYPNPLNTSSDPKQWWIDHRPLLAQTSALGPSDPRQRFGAFWKVAPHGADDDDAEIVELDEAPVSPDRSLTVESLPGRLPNPLFSGCRLIHVTNGVISQIRYLTTADIVRANILFSEPNVGRGRLIPVEGVIGPRRRVAAAGSIR